jgi:AraC-like DNA-binding protein
VDDKDLTSRANDAVAASTLGVRAMLVGFEAIGLDGDDLCRAAGLDRSTLADPDRYVAPPQVFGLWACAMQRHGRADLGLRAGAAVPFGTVEVLDYLFATAATVGEGFKQLVRYFAIGTTIIRYECTHAIGATRVTMRPAVPLFAIPPPLRDYALAMFVNHVRHASGGVVPVRVELAGPMLADDAAYREVFGAEVRFGCEANCFLVAGRDWSRPLPRADAALGRVLQRHAEGLLERIPRADIVGAVRKQVMCTLHDGEPTLESIARGLGIGTRTLQRRLADGGHSLSLILDDTRRELAERYLDERHLSVSEVGLLLGYSEPSAFHRAFKRWTALSPTAYRATKAKP